jgi:uncharacterized membrane protein HdeD (DUF308 family)
MNRQTASFLVTLIRALLAISLGVALLISPDSSRQNLANFMGIFWLSSGLTSLVWTIRAEKGRLWPLIASLVGMFAGIVLLSRNLTLKYVSFEILTLLMSILVILTGVLHIAGGFRRSGQEEHERTLPSVLLGIVEIGLGIALLFSTSELSRPAIIGIGIWALAGGVVLLSDAFRIRREVANTQPENEASDEFRKSPKDL